LFTPEWRSHMRSQLPWLVEANDSGSFDIVVHIRRGDIDPCEHPDRYLPNSHYLTLIDRYLANISDASVTIYSESDSYEGFEEFRQRGYAVKLNSDIAEAWRHMMMANVLILSRSSFSYVPAVLNENKVVYTPFRHGSIKDWDVIDGDLLHQSASETERLHVAACESITTWQKFRKDSWKLLDSINVNSFGF